METLEVKILEPEAEAMLDEMATKKLIEFTKPKTNGKKKDRHFGSMPGLVVYISDDFDEPRDDFAEYM